MSHEMYERLIVLVTEARVAAVNAENEVKLLRQERDRDYREIKASVLVLTESFKAAETDLSEVQSALRAQAEATEAMAREIGNMAQAIDGITQLTKSNFDQLESLRKQVIDGEASIRIDHGEAAGRAQ